MNTMLTPQATPITIIPKMQTRHMLGLFQDKVVDGQDTETGPRNWKHDPTKDVLVNDDGMNGFELYAEVKAGEQGIVISRPPHANKVIPWPNATVDNINQVLQSDQ